ncbi:MAG: SH3 domain-containing protein [Candidatus Paceibacterota bacterium]|jgi:hypothetical protein
MRRQPTLAEILADDTGQIRAEVADLLMEPNAGRMQPARQLRNDPWPLGRAWIIFGLIIGLVFLVISALGNLSPRRPDSVKTLQSSPDVKPRNLPESPLPSLPLPVQPAEKEPAENRIAMNPAVPIQDSRPAVPFSPARAGKTGRVFGHSVSIRTQPSLQGEIIKDVNQDQILNILSFHNGWYQVALANQKSGYIFGAYLIPLNFDVSPYHAAVTNYDRTKLLIREAGHPFHFQVIWPDGQTTRILRNDVALYR